MSVIKGRGQRQEVEDNQIKESSALQQHDIPTLLLRDYINRY